MFSRKLCFAFIVIFVFPSQVLAAKQFQYQPLNLQLETNYNDWDFTYNRGEEPATTDMGDEQAGREEGSEDRRKEDNDLHLEFPDLDLEIDTDRFINPDQEEGEANSDLEKAPEFTEDETEVETLAPEEEFGLELEIEENLQPEMELEATVEVEDLRLDVGATLEVCNLENSCHGDMGMNHWQKEAEINKENLTRQLWYYTTGNEVKQGILQAAYFSFTENKDPQIIYSQPLKTGVIDFDFNLLANANQVKIDLSQIEEVKATTATDISAEAEKEEASGWFSAFTLRTKNFFYAVRNFWLNLYQKLTFKKPDFKLVSSGLNFNTYYLRVLPTENGQIAGQASNEVKVKLVAPQEQEDVTFYTPAKLYEVKIKDFEPIRGREPGVCTGAMILDTDWVSILPTGQEIVRKKGERICPETYSGQGEEAWYESFWNFATSGLDWVSEAYNDLKEAAVNTVAGVACGGNEDCRTAIAAGLDIGLAAMGVPPSIPNFDALTEQGFDYLAGEIAAQAGCPDAVCREAIKDKLREALETNKSTNPGCKGEEEAHRMGIEPLCLPDGVEAHIDPRGTYRQAKVTLEIKRTHEDGSSLMGAPYTLYFRNTGYNEGPVGSWIHNIDPYGESAQITEPLVGAVFEGKTIILPELSKGEEIEIPIVLIPREYWIPEHKEAMHGWSTVVYKDGIPQRQYDDWWKLYYGGTLYLNASISGCHYPDYWEGCTISSDSLTVELPSSVNP